MPILRFPTDISKLQIIKVSIPIFFSNLAIPLVGIVDTGLMGNLDNEKYLNHSNDPSVNDDGIALKDIKIGDEITIDYRDFDDNIKTWLT